jgi:glutathione synthase/RimK-type ligase-like ATP-grasp enzyme
MAGVLLATCTALPDGDEDAELLVRALAELGVAGRWVSWTDVDVDWSAELVVLRSTWDYTADRDAFLAWVDALPRVANSADVVRWNTDKVYLRDLAEAGVPIVETTFAAPGEAVELVSDAAEFVVKPSVGAGSRGVGRFTPDRAADALRHADALHEYGRTVLVQPYLSAVDVAGETALIYVDGRFSHAVRKGPMLPEGIAHPVQGWELYVEERIEPRVPAPEERGVGEAVLAAIRDRFGADQLYARVDLLPSPDGPVLVELELTEPSLFLQHGSGGDDPAATFADAIAARA